MMRIDIDIGYFEDIKNIFTRILFQICYLDLVMDFSSGVFKVPRFHLAPIKGSLQIYVILTILEQHFSKALVQIFVFIDYLGSYL